MLASQPCHFPKISAGGGRKSAGTVRSRRMKFCEKGFGGGSHQQAKADFRRTPKICFWYLWEQIHCLQSSETSKFESVLILFATSTIINICHFGEVPGMDYISIKQLSEKWEISTRRIQILCRDGRIPGAIRIASTWAIPADAQKPKDARIKSGKYVKSQM